MNIKRTGKQVLALVLCCVLLLSASPAASFGMIGEWLEMRARADFSVQPPYWGDMNDDHILSDTDSSIISEMMAGLRELTEEQLVFADVDLDGDIDDIDLMRILSYYSGNDPDALHAYSVADYAFVRPDKLTYEIGEPLDMTGARVWVFNDKDGNNVSHKIKTNISASGYDAFKAGQQTLTATYRGLEFPFNVTVVDTGKPTGSISSSNKVSESQQVTLAMRDDGGLAGYYWGTSSNYTSNSFFPVDGKSIITAFIVSSAGTYYYNRKGHSRYYQYG